MTFISKKENKDKLNFQCTLTGCALQAVKDFQEEHKKKYGENAKMGYSRTAQILLCELYRQKQSTQKG